MDLVERPVIVTSTQLWIIDADSLQSRILSAILTDKLSLQVKIIQHIPQLVSQAKPEDLQLSLINCQNLSQDHLEKHLEQLNHLNQNIKVALFNVSALSNHKELIQWPQVMAMFEEDTDQQQLVKGLAEVIKHGYWLPRHLISFILNTQRKAPKRKHCTIKLTKRELQILEQLSHGLTNAEIGEIIYVSEHTVRSHLYNIYKKIGAKNRIQASAWAKQNI